MIEAGRPRAGTRLIRKHDRFAYRARVGVSRVFREQASLPGHSPLSLRCSNGSAQRSFPRGFAWLAARFGRFDLLEGLDVEPSELVPPAFPLGFIEHAIQARRSMPSRSPTR
jgi:hypothetical protein